MATLIAKIKRLTICRRSTFGRIRSLLQINSQRLQGVKDWGESIIWDTWKRGDKNLKDPFKKIKWILEELETLKRAGDLPVLWALSTDHEIRFQLSIRFLMAYLSCDYQRWVAKLTGKVISPYTLKNCRLGCDSYESCVSRTSHKFFGCLLFY